jgi:hypothetical protein
MIPGIIWALIGYAICEITGRGRITTTVVTAAAGALGLGGGLVKSSATGAPQLAAGLELAGGLVLVLAAAVVIIRLTRRPRRHRHGSAAIASARYVLYDESKSEPVHRGRARPDRIYLDHIRRAP